MMNLGAGPATDYVRRDPVGLQGIGASAIEQHGMSPLDMGVLTASARF